MYQRLLAYKKEHDNSTKVPHNYKKDPKLGRWVAVQRKTYHNNKILPDCHFLLDSIHFEWGIGPQGPHTASWMEMYQRLVAYKKEYSNPHNKDSTREYLKDINEDLYKEDPKLGTWVNKQRAHYRNKTITEVHCQLLDSIGFQWSLRVRGVRSLSSSSAISSQTLALAPGIGKNTTISTGRFNNSTHHHQSCVPDDTTNNATVSTNRSSSPSRGLPILDDSGNSYYDDDDEGDSIII